jgi:uncharacterized UBP type Zn finger protein
MADSDSDSEQRREAAGETGFYVIPRTDCPHLASASSKFIDVTKIIEKLPAPCQSCKDERENWLCLDCGVILCSRYINGDMLRHRNDTKHSTVISLTDLSVWCFSCECKFVHGMDEKEMRNLR